MESIIELRKLQHLKYLEKKTETDRLEAELKKAKELAKELEEFEAQQKELERLKDIDEKLDTIIIDLNRSVQDLRFVKEYIRGSMIVATINNTIKNNIEFIKKNNLTQSIINIFFDFIEVMNTNNNLSFNLNNITIGEKKCVDNTKKYIYEIMDMLGLDHSILEINMMDVTNDEDYARKLQEEYNMFRNPIQPYNNYDSFRSNNIIDNSLDNNLFF